MVKRIALLVIVSATALLAGCATYYPQGSLYTEGKMGVQADGNPGNKEGRACMRSILGLVAYGDASVDAAKRNGNIQNVDTIDYDVQNFLGVYGKYCLVVRGS